MLIEYRAFCIKMNISIAINVTTNEYFIKHFYFFLGFLENLLFYSRLRNKIRILLLSSYECFECIDNYRRECNQFIWNLISIFERFISKIFLFDLLFYELKNDVRKLDCFQWKIDTLRHCKRKKLQNFAFDHYLFTTKCKVFHSILWIASWFETPSS